MSGEVKERALKIIKPRALITFDNAPHRVTKIQQGKRGKGGGFVKAMLRNLITGSLFEKTYTSDEMVEGCELEKIPCTYTYKDGNEFVMMHETTFEEYRIDAIDIAGEDKYLVEGEGVRLLRFQGKPIGTYMHM
jgi:elongation factor P